MSRRPGGRHMDMQTTKDEVVAAAQAGDEAAFSALVERHRRELQVHCYRMLGSLEDSEDQVQETFLRAWRRRESYQGRSTFRAWLYRIATNACLDALAARPRQTPRDPADIPWLQPYPDALLPGEEEPDAVAVARETIELAFLAAVQLLPPRQRAALILRDVLGWPARDIAALLEVSVSAANSALQRARESLRRHLPERRDEWGGHGSDEELALVRRYVEASERGDAAALAAMLSDDARFSMPPEPGLWVGRDAIFAVWDEGGFGSEEFGDIRCLVTAANHQPAVANYVRKPGDDAHRALALDVLRLEGGQITDVVTFPPRLYPAFGLPLTL
jgi:RNA polymerase sigma-70 factor (ECF subfamily)